MTINSNIDAIQGVRIGELQSITSSVGSFSSSNFRSTYIDSHVISNSHIKMSLPKEVEERFEQLENLISLLNNTVTALLVEINTLKKNAS